MNRTLITAGLLLALTSAASLAKADGWVRNVHLFGHAQTWFVAHEQMEEAKGLFQDPSGDGATTSTLGFRINRVRFGVEASFLDDLLLARAQVKMEKTISLLDFFVSLQGSEEFSLYFGQFKIPGPQEVLSSSKNLDFIFRSMISEELIDFSLSRTTYASSLFYGVRSYLRDFGLAVKSAWKLPTGGDFKFFLMVSNGLGANLFMGGNSKREYILSNQGLFSGLRIELANLWDHLSLGAHINYNYHQNMVFNSGRVVYDLHRISYSGDLSLVIPHTGLSLAGLIGAGEIRDDYDNDGLTDLRYSGYQTSLLFDLRELLLIVYPGSYLKSHRLQLAFRFESRKGEWNQSGILAKKTRWTLGVNYLWSDLIKVQLNYLINQTEDPSFPDLDDNALILSFQLAIPPADRE
jgi:hypothetical protein